MAFLNESKIFLKMGAVIWVFAITFPFVFFVKKADLLFRSLFPREKVPLNYQGMFASRPMKLVSLVCRVLQTVWLHLESGTKRATGK